MIKRPCLRRKGNQAISLDLAASAPKGILLAPRIGGCSIPRDRGDFTANSHAVPQEDAPRPGLCGVHEPRKPGIKRPRQHRIRRLMAWSKLRSFGDESRKTASKLLALTKGLTRWRSTFQIATLILKEAALGRFADSNVIDAVLAQK